jgi:hypothetical protein
MEQLFFVIKTNNNKWNIIPALEENKFFNSIGPFTFKDAVDFINHQEDYYYDYDENDYYNIPEPPKPEDEMIYWK